MFRDCLRRSLVLSSFRNGHGKEDTCSGDLPQYTI
ncbi:hypothetical protein EMIT0P291_120041 [Pseudomonas sp. IT-P291]